MRILFVSFWFPYPPDNGSRIRIFNLLRQLSRHHQVTLLSFTQSDSDPGRVTEIQPYCQQVLTVPGKRFRSLSMKAMAGLFSFYPRSVLEMYSTEMQRQVKVLLAREQWDTVIASELLGTAPYLINARTPRVLDDVEITVFREQLLQTTSSFYRWRYWLTWAKTCRYVTRVVRQFNACTVVSEQERTYVEEVTKNGSISVIPNGLDLNDYRGSFGSPEPDTLIFTGVLSYGANYDALRFFLEKIWRQIRAQKLNVHLRVTGRLEGINLSDLPMDDHVEFTGYLPDIRPAVSRSWLSIVPLRIGGGTRVKILESMALGTPVVATSKGAEGLDVQSDHDILIADEPDAIAKAVIRLLNDRALRERLAINGQRLVADKYDWNQIGMRFNALVESVATRNKE